MKCFKVTQKSYHLPVKKRPRSFLSRNKAIHLQSLGMTNMNDLACTFGVQKQTQRRFFSLLASCIFLSSSAFLYRLRLLASVR